MLRNIIKPLLLAVFLIVTLFLSLRSVQARRFFPVNGSTFFDVVRACRDGMEIGFARHSDTVSITGAWWHQASSEQILDAQDVTLDSEPVYVPGTGTVPYSAYFKLPWIDNTSLLPGHRIKLALNETSSQDIWATVQDCLVNDGTLPADRFVFPDISQDDSNGGTLTSGETTFTMTVTLTETVGVVNVAMFVQNDSPSDSLSLSAWLTSPEGTTVQLFNNVSDSGQDFGFRCREQDQNLIGDPLADLVFDDVSQFDFTTPGVFGSFEMLYAISPLEPLSAFQGEDLNGVWSLGFQNLTPAVSADLRCWMLEIADVPPVPLNIVKSVTSASSLPEPGGNFDFQVVVTNTSTVDTATVTALDDTYLADLQTNGICTESGAGNNTTAPYTLSPAETLTCTYTVNHSGQPATFDNTVKVTATDDDGAVVGGVSNEESVTISDVPAVPLSVVKSVTSASSLPEPGGDFDFQVVVSNTSTVDTATVTVLDDTYQVNLQTNGTCTESGTGNNTVAPYTLSPAETLTCTYTIDHSGQPATFENTVTVTATDDDGADVDGTSNEISVTISDVPAVPLSVVKSVTSASSLPEPGGNFDFQVVVTNTSTVDTATVTDLDDTYLANLQTNGTCTESGTGNNTVAPYTLSPAESLICTFTVNHSGQPDTFDNTVTVTATDDDGASVGDDSNIIQVEIQSESYPVFLPLLTS